MSIEAPCASRTETGIDIEFPNGEGNPEHPKKNNETLTTLTNTTITAFLRNAKVMNITARRKLTVNSSINIGNNSHLILWSKGQGNQGVQINEDITSSGGNLTINSDGQINIHKNITLGMGFLNIISGGSVAFEAKGNNKARQAANTQITAQGTINLTGNNKTFKLNNLSLNGTGSGLNIISKVDNLSHHFDGEINISGNVTINQTTNKQSPFWKTSYDSYWNVTSLNLEKDAVFTFVKFISGNSFGETTAKRSSAGVIFDSKSEAMNFNVKQGASVNFKLKSNENINKSKPLPYQFKSNITATGEGSISFDIYANRSGRGVDFNMSSIDIKNGINLTFNSHVRGDNAFKISKDLTINATDSHLNIKQSQDRFNGDKFHKNAIESVKNITILAGNVTLGGEDSSSSITGKIDIRSKANVTLQAHNGNGNNKKLTLGNVSTEGRLALIGASVDINGNLAVSSGATFKGVTNSNLNITGNFTNNGTSVIDVKKGAARFGDIINENSLSVTTNAQNNQKTIITGNITNKKGDLNITDNKANAEIQIGGNISQKEGNLTISSDKVNITNRITIKAGVDEESSGSSSSTKSNANLTIKTKTLELTNDLNISGFNKAEITAKNDSNLTIGKASGGDGDAKKVTFDKVKDSKISANGHKVILNSKVETSNGDSNTEDSSNDNNAGLIITAKDVAVNNNITSHKTVNISAAEGGIDTKAGTTINAIAGSVEITAKTGKINGEVKSASGNVNITASGDTLNVSNISGNTVTITADNSKLTTTEGSIINATESAVNISVKEGDLKGAVEAKKNSVNITAKESNLTVSNVTAKNNVTVKAEKGTLTTVAESKITSTDNAVTVITQNGGTINGNIEAEKGLATVTASTGDLSVANVTGKTAILTATQGKLTSTAGSTINGTDSVTTSSQSGDISGTISGNMVSVKATGDLTTQSGSKIEATGGAATLTATKGTLTTAADSSISAARGILTINAKDAKLDGAASGDRTVVNATNASGSGSVTAVTSSNVNITGDLNTINGLNIISENGRNTVRLRGKEIEVKYIQPGVASVEEVIEAKRVLEKVKDLSDEERETLAKLGVSAVRFVEPNNTITVNTQNEFTTRPSSQVTISEGKACFSSGNGAAVCTNITDGGQQ
ncbi:TPA: beta strand repeat-containing protein [Haemophilus influenzae]